MSILSSLTESEQLIYLNAQNLLNASQVTEPNTGRCDDPAAPGQGRGQDQDEDRQVRTDR